jgi:hypothetical protein
MEQERRKIEKELQKQRKMAIQGSHGRDGSNHLTLDHVSAGSNQDDSSLKNPEAKHVIIKKEMSRKVIVHKKTAALKEEILQGDNSPIGVLSTDTTSPGVPDIPGKSTTGQKDNELLDAWIRQVAEQKKESPAERKALRIDEIPQVTKDGALLHTDLKRDRSEKQGKDEISGIKSAEKPKDIEPSSKKHDHTREDDTLSWVD